MNAQAPQTEVGGHGKEQPQGMIKGRFGNGEFRRLKTPGRYSDTRPAVGLQRHRGPKIEGQIECRRAGGLQRKIECGQIERSPHIHPAGGRSAHMIRADDPVDLIIHGVIQRQSPAP